MQVVCRGRLKTVMPVERGSLGVDGMDQHGARTYDVRRRCNANQRVFEHGLTETGALFGLVHGQSSEQNGRNRMMRQSLCHSRRRVFPAHAAGGDRVIGNYAASAMNHISARGLALLIDPGETL